VVGDSSHEVDALARYGDDEMALILSHTDLRGGARRAMDITERAGKNRTIRATLQAANVVGAE
jgi:hypothetical protein